ncbi:unnamed protein product, partial [Didymodactylos carnosus]
MERIVWSEKRIPFKNLIENASIPKPTMVQIGQKTIVVGEKISGQFITASPCKVVGNRFDVMEQEIIISSKHTGLWRVISKSTLKKEESIHRLTTKDLEILLEQDKHNQRINPRSFICIRDTEAFELFTEKDQPLIVNGRRSDRRVKKIEEGTEFEIISGCEVEYTPTNGERTSQDYLSVPKKNQGIILTFLFPEIVEQEKLIRNRVVRALFCETKNETRKRHFFLEVNEQPSEIRPVASDGSLELRYLHSTQNLYEYLHSHGTDTVLCVKLLRGDPPIKAVEFHGYLMLKSILNGDQVPICRTADLEITLVSPNIPVQVRLPVTQEHYWRTLSEVRAAELQCMQLSLALLVRHESEVHVNNDSGYNGDQTMVKSKQHAGEFQKHIDECEQIFSAVKTQNDGGSIKKPIPLGNRHLITRKETTIEQSIPAIPDKLVKSSSVQHQIGSKIGHPVVNPSARQNKKTNENINQTQRSIRDITETSKRSTGVRQPTARTATASTPLSI